ncbi:MAG TPA: hypothetical protein VMR62_23260 [Bryobacteraceae bacterium]|nr:hypothetical protein [Bryobacteraceae bacterium]
MRSRLFSVSVLTAMLAATGLSQASQPADPINTPDAAITGIWRCQMEGLPAVTLTVTNEGGSLTGAVLFYLHRREPGQPVTATPGVPEPLFHPTFDGKTFTFQVSHRRAHPPKSLNDAPVTFQLKLDGTQKAELVNENEKDPNAPVYVLERSAY